MEEEKEAMDVGIMVGAAPSSRFFNREFEKTPSPEKEEETSRAVLHSADLKLNFSFSGMVADFTYLDKLAESVVEIEDPWTGPGGKTPVNLPELAVAKDGKVMELVRQEYIRSLLKSPPLTKPLPECSVEVLRGIGITDEEIQTMAKSRRALLRGRDIDYDIIQQYLHKGYAYVALPEHSERYPATAEELPPLP